MSDPTNRQGVWATPAQTGLWEAVNQAVHDEVQALRDAVRVFPFRPYPGASSVPADNVDLDQLRINDQALQAQLPFITISRGFQMSQSQVDNESDQKRGVALARLAAREIAQAEDLLIFQGQHAPMPPGVGIEGRELAREGLLGAAPRELHMQLNGNGIVAAVVEGIAALRRLGQPGPYALFLGLDVFADSAVPQWGSVSPEDRITPRLKAGLFDTAALPDNVGLLVSLGGEPVTIAYAQDAGAEHLQRAQDGWHLFRVIERFQFVVRDPRALVRIVFDAPAP